MIDYTDQMSQSTQTEGMDLIAAKAGMVSYIITRSGVPQVALGDTVQEGDVLVSGAVPVYNDDTTLRKYQYVQSDADIKLRYTESVSIKRDILYDDKIYSGKQKKMLMFGIKDREWNLQWGRISYEDYDISGEKKQVRLLDRLYLPIFYGTKTVQEYEIVRLEHTEEEMNAIMQEAWDKIISSLEEKGVQITQKNVTIKKNKTNWVLSAGMQLEESAVMLVPTRTEPIAGEQGTDVPANEEMEDTAE